MSTPDVGISGTGEVARDRAAGSAPGGDDAARLRELLAALPADPPRWQVPGDHGRPAPPERAARALAAMSPADRSMCAMVHGLGLTLGTVSFALRLDPAVVAWRLRFVLVDEQHPEGDPALEAAVAALLRDPPAGLREPPPDGAASWRAHDLLAKVDPAVHERLLARLLRDEDETSAERTRPGIGFGVLFLVGLLALAFLAYGALLDKNPMWRGRDLLRRGEPAQARAAFRQVGNSDEARAWIAISYLAEGAFDAALAEIEAGEARRWLGAFQPARLPLDPLHQDTRSGALLPRGPTLQRRPEFVYAPNRDGVLSIELARQGDARHRQIALLAAEPGASVVVHPYPDDWPSLPVGNVVWSIVAGDGARQVAAFEVLSDERRLEIQDALARKLTAHVPREAKLFLRGHFYLNSGLYMKAADQFALLVQSFPDARYPRLMLAEISRALGVDPMVFLR